MDGNLEYRTLFFLDGRFLCASTVCWVPIQLRNNRTLLPIVKFFNDYWLYLLSREKGQLRLSYPCLLELDS
jgi:hypothetical protein